MIAIVGGGDIAEHGIVPVVGGTILSCDVRNYRRVWLSLQDLLPETVIVTAGVSLPATIAESSPTLWAHEISVNLIGSYNVAKAAVDVGARTLIFIASVAGMYGKPNHSGYSASKGGVISLVQSLAMEGHNAYAISPGRVDTKMREKDYPGEDPRTRLHPTQVGEVVKDILAGKYDPGDNIIVRKIGFDTFTRIDKGEPWKAYLRVGEPVTC